MPQPAAAAALARRRLAVRLLGTAAGSLATLFGFVLVALLGMLGGAPQLTAGGAGDVACALSPDGRDRIPGRLIPLYDRAAADSGLGGRGAVVLAAINKIETDFGRNMGPSSAGAVGWMQFMPATWSAYGVDGDGDGRRNPDDPADAIPAAARYLRANGAPADWYGAVFAYNHADWYVRDVLSARRPLPGRVHDDWRAGGGRWGRAARLADRHAHDHRAVRRAAARAPARGHRHRRAGGCAGHGCRGGDGCRAADDG